jgi:PadR family transcriptional regulator PadR
MADDRLRGHLEALVLATLAAGPAHGYAIAKDLSEATDQALNIPEGSLYPALHRLEDAALVVSRWDEAASRRRRLYAITPAGKEALVAERARWREFRSSIDAVMEGDA